MRFADCSALLLSQTAVGLVLVERGRAMSRPSYFIFVGHLLLVDLRSHIYHVRGSFQMEGNLPALSTALLIGLAGEHRSGVAGRASLGSYVSLIRVVFTFVSGRARFLRAHFRCKGKFGPGLIPNSNQRRVGLAASIDEFGFVWAVCLIVRSMRTYESDGSFALRAAGDDE